MKTTLLAALAALTVATTASADVYDASEAPPQKDFYVGASTSGGASSSMFYLGVSADAGYRIASSVWFIHGQASTGVSGSLFAKGRFTSYRAGLEGRRCAGYVTQVCVLAGADVGVMRDTFTFTEDNETMTDSLSRPMVIPRASLEVGSTVRLRAIVEMPMYGGGDPETGVNIAIGLGYAF
jgi:hypothetical protein